jgi:hypothetical protein
MPLNNIEKVTSSRLEAFENVPPTTGASAFILTLITSAHHSLTMETTWHDDTRILLLTNSFVNNCYCKAFYLVCVTN